VTITTKYMVYILNRSRTISCLICNYYITTVLIKPLQNYHILHEPLDLDHVTNGKVVPLSFVETLISKKDAVGVGRRPIVWRLILKGSMEGMT